MTANQPPTPDPVQVDLTQTRRVAKTSTVFHAWKTDSDMWDGWAMYTNLPDALQTTASDYASEYFDGDDPEPELDEIKLEWRYALGSWHLFDDGDYTNIHVTETAVYTAEAQKETEN